MDKRNLFSLLGIGVLVVLGLIVVSNMYIHRGLQGRLKSATDDIGDQYSGGSRQYEPYYSGTQLAGNRSVAEAKAPVVQSQIVRKVIRNKNLSLKVEDAQQTQVIISAMVMRFNGIVLNSSLNKSSDGAKNGMIVFKVLPKDLGGLLPGLKNLGEVQSESETGEDVTEQYVDLQARLQNYIVVRDRLLKILDEKAREVKDILEIEKELARVGGEIEALQGRMKFLDQQADMATVTVHYYERTTSVFRGIDFGEKFRNTLQTSVETFVNTFNGVIIVLAFLFPIVLWVGLGWAGWWVSRKIFKK